LNVQWEDENLGESICNALKKEEVTYADIEGITGIRSLQHYLFQKKIYILFFHIFIPKAKKIKWKKRIACQML